MTTDYEVLIGDNEVGTLHVNCTDEGVIVDIYDEDGVEVATWARTAQELTEEVVNGL